MNKINQRSIKKQQELNNIEFYDLLIRLCGTKPANLPFLLNVGDTQAVCGQKKCYKTYKTLGIQCGYSGRQMRRASKDLNERGIVNRYRMWPYHCHIKEITNKDYLSRGFRDYLADYLAEDGVSCTWEYLEIGLRILLLKQMSAKKLSHKEIPPEFGLQPLEDVLNWEDSRPPPWEFVEISDVESEIDLKWIEEHGFDTKRVTTRQQRFISKETLFEMKEERKWKKWAIT